jgi:hypothetical protein
LTLQQLRQLRVKNTKLANDVIQSVVGGVAVPPEPEAGIEQRKALAADSVPQPYLDAWARLQRQHEEQGRVAQILRVAAVLALLIALGLGWGMYVNHRDNILFKDFPNGIPRDLTECENGRPPGRLADGTPDCLTHEQWERVLDIEAGANERPEWP